MSRTELLLSQEQLRPFDLETFVHEAATLNRCTLETYTRPFPKAPERWLSHYRFRPRPIERTAQGEVEGGLSWLLGATIDLSFTRALFAPYYSKEGGHCYDPASSFFLEVASRPKLATTSWLIVSFGDDILTERLGFKAWTGRSSRKRVWSHNYLDYKDFSH